MLSHSSGSFNGHTLTMIVSVVLCMFIIQTCGASFVHSPIDFSNTRWFMVGRSTYFNHDDRPTIQPSISDRRRRFLSTRNDGVIRDDAGSDDQDENGVVDVENWESISAELLLEDEDDGLNDGEWLSDKEKARIKLEHQLEQQQQQQQVSNEVSSFGSSNSQYASQNDEDPNNTGVTTTTTSNVPNRPSPYTDEEEEIIAAMGGKSKQQRRREPGFLGDSTLVEICTDYSVPISYLADVLCMWGVPVPINIYDRLGDLVTGEQAFAIVEAVNTLDVAALHDRYSNTNIQQLCYEWDIDILKAFEMAMKEGWSLPFGVQTCLRVEQERELLRVLGSQAGLIDLPDDEYDDEYN